MDKQIFLLFAQNEQAPESFDRSSVGSSRTNQAGQSWLWCFLGGISTDSNELHR